ncbi:hypothetical protein SK128_027713 [Halocaridina rubra]|uniref:Uncharacterized protein n=1 Tax=Halocaridina rubra TaxID=373956 RepID=A0AAN8WNW2_HALRR
MDPKRNSVVCKIVLLILLYTRKASLEHRGGNDDVVITERTPKYQNISTEQTSIFDSVPYIEFLNNSWHVEPQFLPSEKISQYQVDLENKTDTVTSQNIYSEEENGFMDLKGITDGYNVQSQHIYSEEENDFMDLKGITDGYKVQSQNIYSEEENGFMDLKSITDGYNVQSQNIYSEAVNGFMDLNGTTDGYNVQHGIVQRGSTEKRSLRSNDESQYLSATETASSCTETFADCNAFDNDQYKYYGKDRKEFCNVMKCAQIISLTGVKNEDLKVRFARCDYRSTMIVHGSTMIVKRLSKSTHSLFLNGAVLLRATAVAVARSKTTPFKNKELVL